MWSQGGVLPEGRVLAAVLQAAHSAGDRALLASLANQLLAADDDDTAAARGSAAVSRRRRRSRAAEALARAGETGRARELVEGMMQSQGQHGRQGEGP